MNKAKGYINKAVEIFCIFIFSLMVVLVAWQVFSRYVLNNPSSISETLTRYLFVWLVIVSATYTFGSREHMCISYLKEKFSKKVQGIINIVIEGLTIIFSCTVMVYGGVQITVLQMVHMDPNLQIPTGIIYSIIPICGVILVFYCICNICTEWSRLQVKENEGGGESCHLQYKPQL